MNVMALLLADSRFPGGGHVHSGGLEEAAARGLVRTESDLPAFLRNRLRTAGALAAVFAAAAARPGVDWPVLDAELDARTPSAAQRAASRAQGKATARAAKAMLVATPPERESHSFAQWGGAGSVAQPGAVARVACSFGAPDRESPSSARASAADRAQPGGTERESHSFAQGPPGFDVTGGDRQFWVARVAGLLAAVARPHHCVLLGALAGVPADAALAAAYLAVSGPASAGVRLLGLDPLLVNALVVALGPDIAGVARAAAAVAHLEPADLPGPGSPGLDVLAEEHDRHHREEVRLFAS